MVARACRWAVVPVAKRLLSKNQTVQSTPLFLEELPCCVYEASA